MHVFMDAGQGNVLAFFELPNSPPMGRDQNTPEWVQHIAMELETMEPVESMSSSTQKGGGSAAGGSALGSGLTVSPLGMSPTDDEAAPARTADDDDAGSSGPLLRQRCRCSATSHSKPESSRGPDRAPGPWRRRSNR